MKAKHAGPNHVGCPACITHAETQRFPWERDYLTVFARSGASVEFGNRHSAAMAKQSKNEARNKARRERDQAARDCGLVKVKGALGGAYWE